MIDIQAHTDEQLQEHYNDDMKDVPDDQKVKFDEWCRIKEMQHWLKEKLIFDAKMEIKQKMIEEKIKENESINLKWK